MKRCPQCVKHETQHAEPLLPTQLPTLPWQRVAADIFHWKRDNYLLIIDYYSRFIQIAHLSCLTAEESDILNKSNFC